MCSSQGVFPQIWDEFWNWVFSTFKNMNHTRPDARVSAGRRNLLDCLCKGLDAQMQAESYRDDFPPVPQAPRTFAPALMPGGEPFLYEAGEVGCLLVHGFTSTPFEMRGLGRYLAER